MAETWLRLNEVENAVDNLEMTVHFLTHLPGQTKWKWAVIGLHQALYGFLVSALRGTDGRVLLQPSRGSAKEPRLISIWEALERMQNADSFPRTNAVPLALSPQQREAIDWLIKRLRNEFEHFRPMAWSIETSGMPKILSEVADVIEHVALRSNAITYGSEEMEECVRRSLERLRLLVRPRSQR